MAKLMVSTLALIAMVGLINASPLLGGLTGGGAQGQTQGLLGLTGENGGLLTGVVETATGILNSLMGRIQHQTQAEVESGIPEVAQATNAAANQAKNQGLSVQDALIAAQNVALRIMEPRALRIAQAAAIGSVGGAYNVNLQGTYPGLVQYNSQ